MNNDGPIFPTGRKKSNLKQNNGPVISKEKGASPSVESEGPIFPTGRSVKKKSTTVSPSGQNQEGVSSATSTMAPKKPLESSGSVGKGFRGDVKKKEFYGDAGAGKKSYILDETSGIPVWKEFSNVLDESNRPVYGKTITDPVRVKTLNKFFKQGASTSEVDKIYTGFPGQEDNQYREYNGSWQRMQPTAKSWTTVNEPNAVAALNKQFNKDIKPIKGLNVVKEGAKFTDINTKLVSQTEGNVVPYLQKKYSKLGFTFEEAGIGQDFVTVTAKDGKTKIDVSLDEANPEEALKLRHFLSQNASTPESKKSIYLKAKIEEDPNYSKKPEYINALKSLSPDEVEDLIDERKEVLSKKLRETSRDFDLGGYKKAKEDLDSLYSSEEYKIYKEKKSEKQKERATKVDQLYYELNNAKTTKDKQYIKSKINTFLSDDIIQKQTDGYNMQLMDVQNAYKKINSEYTNLNSAAASGKLTQEQYDAQLAKLNQKRVDLKDSSDGVVSQMKKLEKVTGKYLLDKEKMGSFGGNLLNAFVTGISKIVETPAAGSVESSKTQTYEALSPEEKKYLSDKGYSREQAINYVANKNAKKIKEEIRGGAVEFMGARGTTKEYSQSKDRGFFESTLAGVAESLPSMIIPGGALARTAAMSSQAYASIEDEMLNDEDFETTSMADRSLVAVPYAVGMGLLENLGFTKMISKDPLAKSLVMKSITKVLTKKGTTETLESALEKELKSNITKFGLKVVGGTLAEAETGALQSAILDVGLKTAYNKIRNSYENKSDEEIAKLTNEGYFNTPDNLKEASAQILEDAAAEALGGTVMTAAMTGFEKLSNGEITLFNDEDITKLKELSTDPEMKKMFVAKLRTDMVNGDITKEQAKTKLEALRSVEADFTKIPDDITGQDLKRAMELSIEKKDLTNEIAGKDEALVAPKKARIEEINNELKTIGENATKESNKQEDGTEGDIVQREGVDVGQQEVGQGEGRQREAAQPSTDTSDSNISSQEEKVDPLINVETTAKALNNDLAQQIQDESGQLFPLNVDEDPAYFTRLSERYHEAKQNGTEPELVNAFENVLGKNQQPVSEVNIEEATQPAIDKEVEAIGEFITGSNAEIDQKVSRIKNKRIARSVSRAAKALSNVLPDVKIMVHETNDAYSKATGENAGMSNGQFDPKTNTIHINSVNANARTVAHEVFHAVLLNKVKTDANAQAITKKLVDAIAPKIDKNPALKKYLDDFSSQYENNIQNEEKLAEFVGKLAENYNSFTTPIKDIITRWINKLADMFGLERTNDTYDALKTIAGKIASGKEITESDVDIIPSYTQEKELDNVIRKQLSEDDSSKIAKEVVDKTIKGKSIPTWVQKKTKDKVKFVAFTGEINQENVKINAPDSYNTIASKLSNYNTFGLDVVKELQDLIDTSNKVTINKTLEYNKKKLLPKINSILKEIAKIKSNKKLSKEAKIEKIKNKQDSINNIKEIIKIKDLSQQLNAVLNIESKSVRDSLYKSMFYDLGTDLKRMKENDLISKSENIYNKAKNIIKSNLLSVYNSVSPTVRKISKLWYDGANLIAQDMANSYNVTNEQAAAIIATQSPQMPWFDNLHLADVIMNLMNSESNSIFTKELFDYYVSKAKEYPDQIKYKSILEKSIGKKLSELSDKDAAIFIRAYYDTKLSRKAPIRIPTGTSVDVNQKGDSSFSGYDVISKGVSIFRDGSIENISEKLGDANKVRNFYMNIADPADKRAVTIDTHAMAIALFKPLASNDYEVNFDPATFAFYADAYRELANELGIEARALQSITWEAARAIFPAKAKAKSGYKQEISSTWDQLKTGEKSIDQIQEEIFKQAEDPNITEWSEYIKLLKDENARKNVSGRITRLESDTSSDNMGDVSRANIGVSRTTGGSRANSRGSSVETDSLSTENIAPRNQKTINEKLKEELSDKEINTLRKSLRLKFKDSYIIDVLDSLQDAKKNDTVGAFEEVDYLLENGVNLNYIANTLVEEGNFDSKKEAISYFTSIGEGIGLNDFLSREQLNIDDTIKKLKDQDFSDVAIKKYLENQGVKGSQSQEAIRRYNAVKDNVFLNDPKTGIPKIAQYIKKWSKDQLTTMGNRTTSMFEAQEIMDGVIAKSLNKVVRISKDFNNIYNSIPKDLREEFLENYDSYLRGNKKADISEDAKIVANEMRNQIDALSRNIINAGIAPLKVAKEIQENLGSYLTRSYEVFKNKDYKAKEEIIQRAKNFLNKKYLNEAKRIANAKGTEVDFELNRLVNNKIDQYTNKISADDFVGGGKLGSKSKELGVFKERTKIPIEIRQLMGEFTDPVQNYAETVMKLSALSAKNDFLNKIKDAGMGVYLFTEKTRPEGYNVMIAAPGSDAMNPLNGLYTTPEIAKEFNNLPGELGKLMKIYMKAISMIKWGKTIGSVMTHAKNLFGNLGFVAVNGHTSGAVDAFKAIYSDISNSSNEEIRKRIDKYIELGIMKQSAGIGEIRDMFKDADFDKSLAERLSKRPSIKNKPIASVLGRGKRIAKSIGSAAETAYQAEDDFFKVLAYESELRRYAKAEFNKDVKDLTDSERSKIDKTVANIVKDTMPTFSRIPKIVKNLRKSPLLGNFISFQAESYRTAFKTMQLAKSEITSKNPAIRAIGARRVIGTLTYLSAKNALLSFYGSAFGMGLAGLAGYFGDDDDEKEKEKDLRKFLPPWSTQSDIIPIKNSDGTITYIDMSASDPHGGIGKAFNAFFGGYDPIDGAKEAMFSIFKPFLEPEMTAKAMFNLVSGTDNYDRPIWNSEDDWNGIAGNIAEFAFGVAQPGTVTSALRISNSEDKLKEVIGASTGYRPIKIDVGESFGYRVYDYRDRLDKAKELYSSISRNEKATDEQKEKALQKANSKTEEIYKQLMEDYNSAERLGVDSGKLRTELKDKLNLSDKNLKIILSGGYAEVKPKEAERRKIIFR